MRDQPSQGYQILQRLTVSLKLVLKIAQKYIFTKKKTLYYEAACNEMASIQVRPILLQI